MALNPTWSFLTAGSFFSCPHLEWVIYGAAVLFHLEWSRLGRRVFAECRSINKHTGFFVFLSSQMVVQHNKIVRAPSIQNQCCVFGPVMVSVMTDSTPSIASQLAHFILLLLFFLFTEKTTEFQWLSGKTALQTEITPCCGGRLRSGTRCHAAWRRGVCWKMLFGFNTACVLTLIDVAVCRPPLLQTQITHTSGYYRLGGVRQHKNTTAQNATLFF